MSRLQWRYALVCLVSMYCAYYVFTASQWHFIDNVNLIFHEAGHTFFIFFGQFLYVLMGSGFQILLPLVFAGYFFVHQSKFSASITLAWVGINILNVSVYASDAQKMVLPLLGGEHDWNWIFDTLGVLHYTDIISQMMFSIGVCVLMLACYGSFYYAKERELDTDLHIS